MPSKTTPTDFVAVSGLPVTARIYRIEASRFWQFRFYIEGKYVRKSTGETEKARASKRAKELYKDALLKQRHDLAVHTTTFAAVTKRFLVWQETKTRLLGKPTRRTHQEDVYIRNRDILPFFQAKDVSSITTATLEQYFASLIEPDSLRKRVGLVNGSFAKSTLKKHLNVLRKILNYAADQRIVSKLPKFPEIGMEFKARPFFDLQSYEKLLNVSRAYAKEKHVSKYFLKRKKVRNLVYTEDFADLVDFGVQVFVRISDIKDLRHKHIQVFKEGPLSKATFLEIWVPNPKPKDADSPSCSLAKAVQIYERLLDRHRKQGYGKPEDYVLYPELKNRDYALDVMGRLFRTILDENGLRRDAKNRIRTLYSLRHTALMFRVLYGDRIDLHLLAKNALTSVQMLERFNLSHVESRKRIEELQSWGAVGAVYQMRRPPGGSAVLRRARRKREKAEHQKHHESD